MPVIFTKKIDLEEPNTISNLVNTGSEHQLNDKIPNHVLRAAGQVTLQNCPALMSLSPHYGEDVTQDTQSAILDATCQNGPRLLDVYTTANVIDPQISTGRYQNLYQPKGNNTKT